MLAYHNDPAIKAKYVNRAIEHQKADEIVQGYGYWRDGKGCAIGCLAHSDDNPHEVLERDAGLPQVLSYLADDIFEGLPKGKSKSWALRYAKAPKDGADLSLVVDHFMLWLLTEEVTKNFDAKKFSDVAKACKDVATLYQRKIAGEQIAAEEWSKAYDAADAYDAARAAAAYGAAAHNPVYAATSAVTCLAAATPARRARAAYYERMAEKLIELMEAA